MMADAIADTISRYFKQLHLQNSCNYIKKFIAIFLFIGQRGVKYWRKYDDLKQTDGRIQYWIKTYASPQHYPPPQLADL